MSNRKIKGGYNGRIMGISRITIREGSYGIRWRFITFTSRSIGEGMSTSRSDIKVVNDGGSTVKNGGNSRSRITSGITGGVSSGRGGGSPTGRNDIIKVVSGLV